MSLPQPIRARMPHVACESDYVLRVGEQASMFTSAKTVLHAVVRLYVPPSGGRRSRPALDEMVAAVEAGEIDVVVSPWIDRIGCSAANTAALFELFDNAGVALWTPDGKCYDGDCASGKLARSAMAMAAQFERDMIRERVTASNLVWCL
jgi:DNA invertase Pin-like site-specific DNA recombinase